MNNHYYNRNKYVNGSVGGINLLNEEDINNQKRILKDQNFRNKYMRKNFDSEKNFLKSNGLDENPSKINLKYNYVNINSTNRTKLPSVDTTNNTVLEKNPLIFSNLSEQVYIKVPNHNFNINDKITITSINPISKTLRTISKNINDVSSNQENHYLFYFENNSEWIKINIPHELPPSYKDTDENKMVTVHISGFKEKENNYYDNIPISLINKEHKIHVLKNLNNFQEYNVEHFYIKLDKKYNGITGNMSSEYNLKIQFNYLASVPLNYLNAYYPVSKDNLNGFHFITNIDRGGIYFIPLIKPKFEGESSRSMTDIIDIEPSTTITKIEKGGSNIIISKVTKLNEAYNKPNNYFIKLGYTFKNIYKVRIIESIFPNSFFNVRDNTYSEQNNKIYWENLNESLEDWETINIQNNTNSYNNGIYQCEIPSGNYNIDDLIISLENSMNNVNRIISDSIYNNSHNFKIILDKSTSLITIKSTKKKKLSNPFTSITPDPKNDKNGNYSINIKHSNHGLNKNEEILIEGSIDYCGIDSNFINQYHNIDSIVDNNNYIIKLTNINLLDIINDSNGGVNISIFVKDKFRLRFDFNNTLGKLLGFRNIGYHTSITQFSYVITNADIYDSEASIDEFGNEITIKQNIINLTGYEYTIMTIDNLNTIGNSGKIKTFFNKISFENDSDQKIVHNTFINSDIILPELLPSLYEIRATFYTPDGNLIDFNGIDHSYILEIVTIDNKPDNTTIDINTGTKT
jgi:hypothetical protein